MSPTSLLPPTWQVPEAFQKRLGQRVGRQRAMIHDGQLLLILHRAPQPDEDDRQPRLFWRQADGTWSSSHHGGGLATLTRHQDEYAELLHQYDRQLEGAQSARDLFDVLERLAPLRRAIRHMHQVLQEARQGLPEVRELIDVRDMAYDLNRRAELLHDDAQTSLQFLQTQRADEQAADNHRMTVYAHRLNTLAAFFFPLATIAAVLGSGLPHGLEKVPPPWSLILLLTIGVLAGYVLHKLINRKL